MGKGAFVTILALAMLLEEFAFHSLEILVASIREIVEGPSILHSTIKLLVRTSSLVISTSLAMDKIDGFGVGDL